MVHINKAVLRLSEGMMGNVGSHCKERRDNTQGDVKEMLVHSFECVGLHRVFAG